MTHREAPTAMSSMLKKSYLVNTSWSMRDDRKLLNTIISDEVELRVIISA